jgi:hypothetical protein
MAALSNDLADAMFACHLSRHEKDTHVFLILSSDLYSLKIENDVTVHYTGNALELEPIFCFQTGHRGRATRKLQTSVYIHPHNPALSLSDVIAIIT